MEKKNFRFLRQLILSRCRGWFVASRARLVALVALSGDPPARSGDPPARSVDPPARSVDPPARSGDPPARSGDPPARSGDPPASFLDPPARFFGFFSLYVASVRVFLTLPRETKRPTTPLATP